MLCTTYFTLKQNYKPLAFSHSIDKWITVSFRVLYMKMTYYYIIHKKIKSFKNIPKTLTCKQHILYDMD